MFTRSDSSPILEGEAYRVRFEANTIESEMERIADFFQAYAGVKQTLGEAVDDGLMGDFVDFIVDTVKRLRNTEGAEFAEFSLHVRDQRDRIFVETLVSVKSPSLPHRSSRESGLRQVHYLR
jgi:hypothetical protein